MPGIPALQCLGLRVICGSLGRVHRPLPACRPLAHGARGPWTQTATSPRQPLKALLVSPSLRGAQGMQNRVTRASVG